VAGDAGAREQLFASVRIRFGKSRVHSRKRDEKRE
jgi:hypothetical protein